MENKTPSGWSLEDRFFAFAQSRKVDRVKSGDLVRNLGLSESQERKLLSSLNKRNLIARVRRGLYLVPEKLPVGGIWSPGEALALNTLMRDRNGQYQVSGLNAFRRYGWDQQIPNRTFAYNDKISGERKIGANEFDLAKVKPSRLGSTEEINLSDGETLVFSSRARALVDAIQDWKRFNSLPNAYGWLTRELNKDVKPNELIEVAIEFANIETKRRIGFVLENDAAPRRLLIKLEKAIPKSSSNIPLVPTRAKRGRLNSRWGVVNNSA